jgi:hypothetical protein
MKLNRLGTETFEEGVLVTRIKRKPPSYRLEQVMDDGRLKVAMLVKAPKGQSGYDVVLDGYGLGFRAPTRRKALRRFVALEAGAPGSAVEKYRSAVL